MFPILAVQEAGLNGFWIHRVLERDGVESYVVDRRLMGENPLRKVIADVRFQDGPESFRCRQTGLPERPHHPKSAIAQTSFHNGDDAILRAARGGGLQ